MNIHHVLFFCFLSGSLCDEDDGSPRHIRVPITTPETSKESASSSPPVLLVLGVCVPVVVVAVLLAVVLLFLHKKKTRGILECTKTENFPPVSTCEDTYQSLDLTSRDKDQIYSTLTQTQHK
ncbi:uncharacterized protein LOC127376943 isoform X4 [Dicentrarchus labrax]|uniref:uncharacterized protein LOC127376943 isoform X4 n=1 Tax=Dicentrarchus labrax TaxID=13489 RepID=UPI0021F62482|nr:uncharacterized protein LOC127376943 isoform X4 [Dicentrarchus labrax]